MPNHAVALAINGVGFDQARMQCGPIRRFWELPVEQFDQLGSARAMEIGCSTLFLIGQAAARRFGIEQQREDPVEISGIRVHGGDVAIQRKVARSETNGRFR